MGQTALAAPSDGSSSTNASDSSTTGYTVISNVPESHLKFNPETSYMLAIGVDKQNDSALLPSLGETVAFDALRSREEFVKTFSIKNSDAYCSSDNPSRCTCKGIQQAIVNGAKNVKEDGIFILFMSGHGISEDFSFAPADFNPSDESTYLTADLIRGAIARANSRSKYNIVLLDCCYSGAMASKITGIPDDASETSLLSNVYVLAASTNKEISYSFPILQNSIFSFFLKHALHKVPLTPGVIPIQEIFEEVKVCSKALTSFPIHIEERNDKLCLIQRPIVPSLAHFTPSLSDTDEIDGYGKCSFVTCFFDSTSHCSLDKHSIDWMDELAYSSEIHALNDKNLLLGDPEVDRKHKLLMAVVILIMRSVAAIELFHNATSVGERNVVLLAFMKAIATLDLVCSELPIDHSHLYLSCSVWMKVLEKHGKSTEQLSDLMKDVQILF